MRRFQAFLALVVLLSLMGFGLANTPSTVAKPVVPIAKITDCCDDPACPPGCGPECPPDCSVSTAAKKTKCCDCPPCPFCP